MYVVYKTTKYLPIIYTSYLHENSERGKMGSFQTKFQNLGNLYSFRSIMYHAVILSNIGVI